MAAKKQAPEAAEKPAKAPKAPEPSDVNSALGSDRMKALLEDHRKMGSRP
jgi:hypothetical protein